jgi:PAS domain S-box-containing protein
VLQGSVAAEPFLNGEKVLPITYNNYQTGLFDLVAGRIDAFAGPTPVVWRLAMDGHVEGQIAVMGSPIAEFKRAFGVKKGRTDLAARIDKGLEGLVGSPEYQKLYAKWYGHPKPYFTLSKQNAWTIMVIVLIILGMAYWRHQSLLGISRRLHQNEAELRATLEATADGILAVDNEGTVVHASSRFAELWRIPKTLMERKDDRALLDFVLDQLTDPGAFLNKVQSLYGSDAVDMDTLAFKDGRVFERHSFPMKMDGIRIGRVWSFRDISERKQNEKKIQQDEAKYRNLFDLARDGIFILDLDGNFIDVNMAAYVRLGYTKKEMLCLHISKLDHPEFASQAHERMRQIREYGFGVFESAHLLKDGTAMPVEVNTRLIEYEGRTVFFSIVRDISERKKTEQALRDAFSKVKLLKGLLPICSACKKIRDDQGYWKKIETYVAEHTDAEFSHGICPECAKDLYPQYYDKMPPDDQQGSNP